MLVWIWTRNDAAGLDGDFFEGDIFKVRPDSFEPSIGDQEKKSWLIVKMPDHPTGFDAASPNASKLVESEYTLGADGLPEVRKARKYRMDWRAKFTPDEITIIEDANATLGVVYDRFEHRDIARKN